MNESRSSEPLVSIRDSESSDMPSVQAIYAEQVLHGNASFEEEPPSIEAMETRRQGILALKFPYVVAECNHTVVGYAYVGQYRTRSAYRFTVEDTVYVHQHHRGQGIGKLLLLHLIERCTAAGFREMIGIAGDSANVGSVRLHQACGFRVVGTLEGVGFKHQQWLDTVIMQRALIDE